MNKLILIFTLTLSVVTSTFADSLSHAEVKQLKDEINSMMKLFENGDAQALIDHTHESIFELMGGKDAFEKLTKQAVVQLMNSGIKFLDSELGTPTELYPAGNYEVCFVPRTSVMEIQGKKVKSIGFMIAIRTKGEDSWKYLDGSGLRKNPQLLGVLFPELDPNIVLPPNTVELL